MYGEVVKYMGRWLSVWRDMVECIEKLLGVSGGG